MRSTSLLLAGPIALFAALLPTLLAVPASADLVPGPSPCQAPGAPCDMFAGGRGVCVEFACDPDHGSLTSVRLSDTSCLECRARPRRQPPTEPAESAEPTVEPPDPDEPVTAPTVEPDEPSTDPAEPAAEPPADVPPLPTDAAPSEEEDSFFGCAAHGAGSGLVPLGPLGFVALAWSVLFIRRRRGR